MYVITQHESQTMSVNWVFGNSGNQLQHCALIDVIQYTFRRLYIEFRDPAIFDGNSDSNCVSHMPRIIHIGHAYCDLS